MDGWQKVPAPAARPDTQYPCISGYTPSQAPNLAALAGQFAISDHTFSMGTTRPGEVTCTRCGQPGRLGEQPQPTGAAAGLGWGCNTHKVTEVGRQRRESAPEGTKLYSGLSLPGQPYGGAFKPTPVRLCADHSVRLVTPTPTGRIYDGARPPPSRATAGGRPSFADCLDTAQKAKHMPQVVVLHDAAAGNLPNFSVIIPGGIDEKYSQHNSSRSPPGTTGIGPASASALMNGPDWPSTALFITCDDCGCFYDQVQSRSNPTATWQGPRSPLVIVSPFARSGFTDTTSTLFAGILASRSTILRCRRLGRTTSRPTRSQTLSISAWAPLRPARMIYRKWPRDAYHVNLAEGRDDT